MPVLSAAVEPPQVLSKWMRFRCITHALPGLPTQNPDTYQLSTHNAYLNWGLI